ncbi:copia LTR rider [Trifolium medium]|uniref:Copia LTR rider n=1 Tax=Trifolium medium TaxID=97028 RepID=A0A392MX35_9FABA|nr:copia LTR rider [Trifolium medium]
MRLAPRKDLNQCAWPSCTGACTHIFCDFICVYMMKRNEKVILYLLLYIDDILIASSDKQEIQKLKMKLNGEFEMKDLGNAKKIHGIDIIRDRSKGELFLSQQGYLRKVVERFRMMISAKK